MKCDEISTLLVEVSEGSIAPEQKRLVEDHLITCERCTESLALLGTAFETLRGLDAEDVPTHYFANLLPKVRRRLTESHSRKFRPAVPEWTRRLLAPASALGIVAAIVALFVLLNPGEEAAESRLAQLVSQVPRDEMEGVAELTNFSPVLVRTAELHRATLETLPNLSLVSRHIEQELADDEVSHGHRMSTFLAAEISYDEISDEEADSIIDRLKETTL